MAQPKLGKNKEGKDMHYSVGALIKIDGKFLLIDRMKEPLGFAGVAGHIDEGEKPQEALIREVREESGLEIKDFKLLFEEELKFDKCSRGIKTHYGYLYECSVFGKVKQNIKETKSIGLFSREEIFNLNLEPAWKHWFDRIS